MTALELAQESAKILHNKKAMEIKIIGIEDISVLTDYFVIANGTSNTHVKALADEVEYQLKQKGIVPGHIEGHNNNGWILMDYGNVIVHVFQQETREFYDLDRLWKDGVQVDLTGVLD